MRIMRGRQIAIEKFLEVALPADTVLPDGGLKFFAEADINDLILERRPFFWIDKAVSIGNDFMLTSTLVTRAQCEGHFPDHPVVPLIEIFRIAAQTGLLLTALNIPDSQEPIAGGSGKNRAKTNEFIEAPAIILAEAIKTHYKMGLYFIDTKIYANNFEVATAENIIYMPKPKSAILAKTPAR